MHTRSLPISLTPSNGETAGSYLTRLAAANSTSNADLWSLARKNDPALPYKPAPEFAWRCLEQLGNLESGWFARDRARNVLPRRCPHNKWRYALCSTCSQPPSATPGCTRCARGEHTTVRLPRGPVCLKHSTWRTHERNFEVANLPDYRKAEHTLRTSLYGRGVGLDTGELALAYQLISDWASFAALPSFETRRRYLPADVTPAHYASLYPEIVTLAETLTSPAFATALLTPKWSANRQADLLINATAELARSNPPPAAIDRVYAVVRHAREATEAAYGMVGTRRSSRATTLQRALLAAARTHRACLLRHLDTRALPSPEKVSTRYRQPAPRSFAADMYLPDR